MELVGAERIAAAAQLLEPVVRRTPVLPSRVLTEHTGVPVHLKCENLQRTGSFKIRGAYTRLHALSADERAQGVVAASAGNHAQGVALAAQLLGIGATVFMPAGASLPKLAATRAYGAQVYLEGAVLEDSIAAAMTYAERTGAVFIHPFDHLDVIAGQGTCGLEIVQQLPKVATVLVCTGGGGLLAGIAAAARAHRPGVRIIGVQAEAAAAWPASLVAGHPVTLREMSTMADGIAVGAPSPITYAHVEALVDQIVTVSEDALSRALLLCLERSKMVVEPAGAAAVAALLDLDLHLDGPVCAVLSGGNIDPLLLAQVMQHGLSAAGRYLSLQVTVPDRPGCLAALLSTLGAAGGNVIDVAHSRLTGTLALGEVEIETTVETRGASHSHDLVARLREHGYQVAVMTPDHQD
ncbi:threonine ammonia-lyase [Dermatophilaceae bacterium Sec6.4]